jgi:hypothetical protein
MDNLNLQHVGDNSVNHSPLAVSQTAICARVGPGGLLRNLRDTPMTEQTIGRILKIGHFSRSTVTGGSTRPFSFSASRALRIQAANQEKPWQSPARELR